MAQMDQLQVPLNFSANQIDDLLWIRRLFHCKLGQLARERRAVVHQMTQSQVDLCHPSEKLSGLTDWAERLKQNGMEEYRTFHQFAVALLRGVSQDLACLQCAHVSMTGLRIQSAAGLHPVVHGT